MRTVYVNGDYLPEDEAKISVFDRGFLFADAVYEVTSVLDGKLIDFAGHMARLSRSLSELDMPAPVSDEEMLDIHRTLVTENGIEEGMIYLQVTRGAADRDFLFPDAETRPNLVLFTQKKSLVDSPLAARGQKVVSADDLRWRRSDIKTTQLLYASWAKSQAHAKGADDVWLVRDGLVTEGSSNNAYIVTTDGTIVTRQLSSDILSGITRQAVLQCARELQIKVEERPFTPDEVKAAREAFSTSASSFVCPVIEIDGVAIGEGEPGPVARRLREIYIEKSRAAAM
ncbi:D-amino-acid transaminase [Notoacmeibacter sp. MSK16QG-6]|uniref:D-amino-acid transaminase n=1 Tax=Notoacmeibacter sp. MSK16QG-6 TaxID=2957982 RepID=UPI00209E12DF|nr:D-amino-acid transaminase [Notoacmeibacter sp. MSK16QG-6]MCP1198647.1 D-amino-acid transaminase [Notoacmeibacter sp. MSK16QG-6]